MGTVRFKLTLSNGGHHEGGFIRSRYKILRKAHIVLYIKLKGSTSRVEFSKFHINGLTLKKRVLNFGKKEVMFSNILKVSFNGT